MPKNRKRVAQRGAKSEPILTKFKIGGRKSGQGVEQMSTADIQAKLENCRPRDKNKLIHGLMTR